MAVDQQSSHKQIRNFLIVLFGGSLFGLLIVLALIYSYGPSTTYIAKNVLLSPEVLKKMWYTASSASTRGEVSRFSFREIAMVHFNRHNSAWESKKIDLNNYSQFYHLVKNDQGSSDNEELRLLFQKNPAATIIIIAETPVKQSARMIRENFQKIEFSQNGEAYRVELKEGGEKDIWAYFQHDNIYNEAMKIFKL